MTPTRIFLDTNVYIIGAADLSSDEGRILRWAGFDGQESDIWVVISDEVVDQIRRVGRRLAGKDWAGALLARVWRNMKLAYVTITDSQLATLRQEQPSIPSEDLSVYLTARNGAAECFVSYNHELITALAASQDEFQSMTPVEFVRTYLDAQPAPPEPGSR
jgi:predicted nucleic acid-binding protein